jgi:hypothetical protein
MAMTVAAATACNSQLHEAVRLILCTAAAAGARAASSQGEMGSQHLSSSSSDRSSDDLDGTEELFAAMVEEDGAAAATAWEPEPAPPIEAIEASEPPTTEQHRPEEHGRRVAEDLAEKRDVEQDRRLRRRAEVGEQGLSWQRVSAVRAAQLEAESSASSDDDEVQMFASASAPQDGTQGPVAKPSGNTYDAGQWPNFVDKAFMRPSSVAGCPPTLVFGLRDGAELSEGLLPVPARSGRGAATTYYTVVEPFEPVQLPLLTASFGSAGVRMLPKVPRGARWSIRWSAGVAPTRPGMERWSVYGQLGQGQYYNHFPGSHELGHKHLLHDNFEMLIERCGGGNAEGVAPFWPRCWQLSSQPQREAAMRAMVKTHSNWLCSCAEQTDAARAHESSSSSSSSSSGGGGGSSSGGGGGGGDNREPLWILKPIHQSRGIGIRLISSWDEITEDEEIGGYLVQRCACLPACLPACYMSVAALHCTK